MFAIQFDPDKYLDGFYKTEKEDTAMQIVLFFLPGMVCRLPRDIGTLLDLGAGWSRKHLPRTLKLSKNSSGPTVYIPLATRNHVSAFYSADYAQVSLFVPC